MDKDIRICIVGGGPAGLSAGMYLEQKGYDNYTILERLDRVGGKCWSPHYNGRRYEMGAIMGVPSYYAVHDVEEFCGITHDGPTLNRNYKNAAGDVIEPFEPKKNPLKIPRLLKMKKQVKKLGELLETKYQGYDVNGHRGVAEGRYDGFSQKSAKREPVSGENPNLKDLALPFNEFCKKNGVELIQDIWIGADQTDAVPAAVSQRLSYSDRTHAPLAVYDQQAAGRKLLCISLCILQKFCLRNMDRPGDHAVLHAVLASCVDQKKAAFLQTFQLRYR